MALAPLHTAKIAFFGKLRLQADITGRFSVIGFIHP
jgi:hypothetical protein